MSALALVLILAAAFLHAGWNLIFKQARGGLAFIWLSGVVSCVLYAPPAIVLWQHGAAPLNGLTVAMMVGSGLIHVGYSLMLQLGYRHGDLSLVYPLARGTGPLLSFTAAVLFLGERPELETVIGAALVISGVFLLSGGMRVFRPAGRVSLHALIYGLLCGVFIAAYTIWDRQAVAHLLLPPLLFDWGGNVVRTVIFTPFVLRRRPAMLAEWSRNRGRAIAVGVLAPLSYILVLTAFTLAPVTVVAPAREVSILIGAVLGARILREADAPRRLFAAAIIVIGVIALAAG